MTLIVHILNHDKPLCGFTTEAPAQWPQDREGVDLDEVDDEMGNVNCPRCRVEAVVQALEPLHLRYDSKTGLIMNGPLVAGSIQQHGEKWHVEITWSGVTGGDITFDGPTLESALAFVEAIEAGFGKRFTDNWLGRVKEED